MVFLLYRAEREAPELVRSLLEQGQPDTTAQGDAVCKGCGRSFDEVQRWQAMSPAEKRAVWHRITREGTAWRFNRYAERARLGRAA